MNPSLKLALVLIASFELAFMQSYLANIIIALLGLIYLLIKRINPKRLLWLLIVPIIPVMGTWFSFYLHGSGDSLHSAWLLSTRIYAYIALGGVLTFTVTVDDLLGSLEQNAHIPSKFVYGTLGAFNFAPRVVQTVKQMKIAAMMRGEVLHVWSPEIFFKSILVSIRWSDNLAQAMQSHGFSELTPRTHYKKYPIPAWNWILAIILLIALQLLAFSRLE
ncbi:energy-coupling factor transporter transmembrane component T family protein [Companilactobacillus ginsenosidimutans]|uniref:ABC transporter permease n=1 Tax=Companilactobacillus ginsenosidimutans TaxID=1007676 RepID=A0A0H4QHN9_9LACO|nr:energy-coupling factor transporter transmembrane component T [Companilactobacillus ginsenosidimutans]AKP67904.1 ABC transporter permease [Companilactobacillus ginsenosidimutans]